MHCEGFSLLVILAVTGADLVPVHTAVDPENDGSFYLITQHKELEVRELEATFYNLTRTNASIDIDVLWTFQLALSLLYVRMNEAAVEAVRQMTDKVKIIEQDFLLYPQTDGTPEQPRSVKIGEGTKNKTASKAIGVDVSTKQWALDRIDQRNLPLDYTFSLDSRAGTGANIYVIGTGIHVQHEDFGGRAINIYDYRGDDWNGRDCNGHGTILASVAAGKTYGVAKNATIYGMRVTRCRGSGLMSDSVKALAWLAGMMAKSSVALFGLASSGQSPSLDNAIHRLFSAGCLVVVPAGNNDSPACDISPARVKELITVAASTAADHALLDSNYGECVDLYAPGSSVVGAFYDGTKTATSHKSGTSIAAALVTGAVAKHLGSGMPKEKIKSYLVRYASEDQLHKVPNGTPNKLLYVGKVKSFEAYERVVKSEDDEDDEDEDGEAENAETVSKTGNDSEKTEL